MFNTKNKPTELTEDKSSLLVKQIRESNEEGVQDNIALMFGISQERHSELAKLMEKYWKQYGTVVDAAVAISKHVKHANELFWVSFLIGLAKHEETARKDSVEGFVMGSGKTDDLGDMLIKALEEMKRRHEKRGRQEDNEE